MIAPVATILDALPPWAMARNLILQAGAGTGKTHALVTLALHLLGGATARREPVAPGRLVALTFTEKAGAEMRERLQKRLEPLARGASVREKEPDLARTFDLLALPIPPAAFWQKLRRDVALATVGTFHSFCAAQLRRLAAYAGLDPGFAVLDDDDARTLFHEATQAHVFEALARGDDDVRWLVDEFGLSGDRPVGLVGLARDVLSRVEEEGRPPDSLDDGRFDDAVAAAAFVAAAADVRAAIERLGTMEAKHVAKLGGAPDALRRAIDSIAADSAGKVLADLAAARKGFRKPPGDAGLPVAMLDDAIETLQTAAAGVRAAPLGRAFVRLLAAIDARYRAAKAAREALDFSDLQRLLRDLLRTNVEARRELKARIGALLVDEFQDTSRLQLELVALLAESREAEATFGGVDIVPEVRWEPGLLCAVGDRKQSIYEFRGADVAVFSALEAALLDVERSPAPARIEYLRRSWRTRPALVRLANELFRRAMPAAAQPFEVAFGPEDALEPTRPDVPGLLAELITATGENAEEARLDEARRIASRIDAMLRDPADPVRVIDVDRVTRAEVPRRVEGRDVALLFRRMTHLDLYRAALAERGIAHVVVGGGGFYEAQEVLDAWALLRVVDDPGDPVASAALLRSPWCSLSDPTLARLSIGQGESGAYVRGVDVARLLREKPPLEDEGERARLDALLGFVGRMRPELDRLGAAGVLALALEELDYLAVTAVLDDADEIAANLEKLRLRVGAFEARSATPRGAIRELTQRIREGAREAEAPSSEESDPRSVRLMTVHQSKGLEFPVVFVVDCGAAEQNETARLAYDRDLGLGLTARLADDKAVPASGTDAIRERLRARSQAETLRLLYVATTRARDYLVFSGAAKARTWFSLVEALGSEHVRPAPEPSALREPPPPPPTGASVPHENSSSRPAAPGLALVQITATVTRLQDFAQCPERYRLRHEVGLQEHPPAHFESDDGGDDDADESPLDVFARGTLAHALLELAGAGAGRTALDAHIRALGYDPSRSEIAEVRADVEGFLASPFAQRLAALAPGRRLHELPFFLTLDLGDGRRLGLKGQIDLVAISDCVQIVDYKHARRRPGAEAHYAFQLRCYAVAVRELVAHAPLPVQVALVFLKEREGAVAEVELSPEQVDAHANALRDLGRALLDAHASGRWSRLERPQCDELACGYRARCHPRAR